MKTLSLTWPVMQTNEHFLLLGRTKTNSINFIVLHCIQCNLCTAQFCFSYSGDGTLSVFNIRRQKIEQRSDNMESELLSVTVVKVILLGIVGKVWWHIKIDSTS